MFKSEDYNVALSENVGTPQRLCRDVLNRSQHPLLK